MSAPAVLPTALALAASGAGVGLVRRSWRRPGSGAVAAVGWGLMAAAVPLWALQAGWDKAAALALLVPSLVALAVAAAGLELRRARPARAERTATELPDRSGEAVWRALVRTLYGGPLAGLAALLLAAAWALKGLGSPADRDGVALLAAPVLWAGGLTWATTDPRLLRIGAGLGALAAVGGLAAWL